MRDFLARSLLSVCLLVLCLLSCGRVGYELSDERSASDLAPLVRRVVVARGDAAPAAMQTVSAGEALVLYWHAEDDEVLGDGSIAVFETRDDQRYTLLKEGIANEAGPGCSLEPFDGSADEAPTGCITLSAPRSDYFRLQVRATDADLHVGLGSSSPLNTGNFRFVVGPGDLGSAGDSRQAAFIAARSGSHGSDSQSLVVTSKGVIYYRDQFRGILRVDPVSKVQEVFIPLTGTSAGDKGEARLATLAKPIKIDLDAQERLLIYDGDRIRRVDLQAPGAPIDTIVGGGDSAAASPAPLDLRIDTGFSSIANLQAKERLFTSAPNGDIYFTSESQTGRMRHYVAADNRLETITLSGSGYSRSDTQDLSSCTFDQWSLEWDDAGRLARIMARVRGTCSDGWLFADAQGVSQGPHPPNEVEGLVFPARFGHFFTSRGDIHLTQMFTNRLYRWDSALGDWQPLLGSKTLGHCPDGTAALECDVELDDSWIDNAGTIYFVDHGKIRTIDSSGLVQTLAGASLLSGDGGPALKARVRNVDSIGIWSSGADTKLVFLDVLDHLIREVTIGGSIKKIAGNFSHTIASLDEPATTQGLRIKEGTSTSFHTIAVNPGDGSVYFNRGERVARLDRGTGRWQDIVGGGAVPYYDPSADGMPGNAIDTSSLYLPTIYGFANGDLAVGYHRSVGGYTDSMVKLYDTNLQQSHLVGQGGVVSSEYYQPMCTDQTPVDECLLPRALVSRFTVLGWDEASTSWLIRSAQENSIHAVSGGVVRAFYSLPIGVSAVTYASDALGGSIYFFCSAGELYRHRPGNAEPELLPFPAPAMSCTGHNLIYDAANNSLLLGFQQLGLHGVVELRAASPL